MHIYIYSYIIRNISSYLYLQLIFEPTGFYLTITQDCLHNLWSLVQNEMWGPLFKIYPEFQDSNKEHYTKQWAENITLSIGPIELPGSVTHTKQALFPSFHICVSLFHSEMPTGNINTFTLGVLCHLGTMCKMKMQNPLFGNEKISKGTKYKAFSFPL